MPGVFFTTNPSDFSQLPGLYIQEVNPPGFIQAVQVAKLGLFGQTLRGPVDTPVEITSPGRFTEVFGDRGRFNSTVEVNFNRQFLMNKQWASYIVVRTAAAAAAAASRTFNQTATPVFTVAASSVGAWGADLTVDIVAATSGVSTQFDLIVNYRGGSIRYQNLDINATNDNLATVVGNDIGRLVTLTKVAPGRPDNTAAAALNGTAGSDGSIADADYTATGRGINKIKNYPGVGIVACSDRQTAAVKSAMSVAAAASSDRLFLIWNGNHAETQANLVTDAALYRSDRIVYCSNSPFTFDFDVGLEVQTPPHAWLATVLCATDVDVDPLDVDNRRFLAGITRLTDESLERADFITRKNAGIMTLEKTDGIGWADGIVNFLTSGRTRITRRRSADFLILSQAQRLRFWVGKTGSLDNRIQMGSEIIAFLENLRSTEKRIVEDFSIDQKSQNTDGQRAQGIEIILEQVKLVNHMLSIVLKAQIGETVVVTEAEAA